ncbi:hypothetical protein SBA1_160018 [Candidatus Sulfotelmatobacter kueseliae]|uniref:Uncharacterized protein n=1 Tax=Candidatus Sulfotelmatobacter kueseliae TaxID=2042962 RepID=A0A2U3KAL0_9BACT|nr:hypothetical protein SBA1_160018 [Candidatus Sulfotelmatobacter kueseliae]
MSDVRCAAYSTKELFIVTVATLLASALSLLHVCKANHGEFFLFLGRRTPCRHIGRESAPFCELGGISWPYSSHKIPYHGLL